ncbi:hypothetical protein F8A10_13240 [Paracoccus kondratievae]|uniref:hypothetical protein n=1 Tax=Paracoccus kondratievae TaxID=135740 RepID=UPI001266099E|nr:hypothetical protein [Paracoccus kondratievae]QFQ88457.1 hypothetical protein F8A10_13240 [Paracoccus kondratievae]
MQMNIRFLIASAVAPLLPPLLIVISASATGVHKSGLGFALLFSAVFSYSGLGILGFPGLYFLQKSKALSVISLTAYGAVAGSVVYVAFLSLFALAMGVAGTEGILSSILFGALAGACLGAGVALIFGWISGIRFLNNKTNPSI